MQDQYYVLIFDSIIVKNVNGFNYNLYLSIGIILYHLHLLISRLFYNLYIYINGIIYFFNYHIGTVTN